MRSRYYIQQTSLALAKHNEVPTHITLQLIPHLYLNNTCSALHLFPITMLPTTPENQSLPLVTPPVQQKTHKKWKHLLHRQKEETERLSIKELSLQLVAKKRREKKQKKSRRASAASYISEATRVKHSKLHRNFWIDLLRNHVDTHHDNQSSLNRLATIEVEATSNTMAAYEDAEHQSILEDLAEQFDQTQAGIASLFALLDEDESDSIGKEEFRIGLTSQNLLHLDGDSEDSFNKLVNVVDSSGDGQIDIEEFSMCLERLRLARLHLLDQSMIFFRGELYSSHIHCIDYDSFSTVTQLPVLEKEVFFFGSDATYSEPNGLEYVGDPSLDTRWIHMIGHDNVMILQLGVKFGLHPMSVLDALQLHEKSASCSKYGEDFFLSFPQIRLDTMCSDRLRVLSSIDPTNEDLEIDTPPFPLLIHLEEAATGIFYMHDQTILISLELDWKPFSEDQVLDSKDLDHLDDVMSGSPRSMSNINSNKQKPKINRGNSRYSVTGKNSSKRRLSAAGRSFQFQGTGAYEDVVDTYGQDSVLALVLKQLTRKYTVIRRSGVSRLLHAIVEKIVDNMRSIPAAYRIQLDWYHRELLRSEAKFSKEHVQALLVIKREIGRLEHKLKPLEAVMTTLIHSGAFDDTTFFEDVLNDLKQVGYELSRHKGTVEELTTSFEHYHDRKLNNSLAVLTTITGAIVPWQMFTAFWGMNFMTEDGGFQDWFLEVNHGLVYASVLLVVMTLFMYGGIRYVIIG